jgi:hypothetical protein
MLPHPTTSGSVPGRTVFQASICVAPASTMVVILSATSWRAQSAESRLPQVSTLQRGRFTFKPTQTSSWLCLSVLAETAELPPRRSYDRVRDLIQRASTALGLRILSFSRCNGDSVDHQRCHLAALSKIRFHIQNDALLRRDFAFKREEQTLSGLLRRRIQLEKQLQILDLELAVSDTNFRAIREFWRCEKLEANVRA